MAGQWIEINAADGGQFQGSLAGSASGTGTGIVLCQAMFALHAYIHAVAA